MIEIRKVMWREDALEYWTHWDRVRRNCKVTLYIVIVDGRRVDSFQRYRNAQRRVRELRATSSL